MNLIYNFIKYKMILGLLIANALIGLAILELELFFLRRVIAPNPALIKAYPCWVRHDVHNLSRSKLYLGAMTLMPIRIVLLLLLCIAAYLGTVVCLIGVTVKLEEPIPEGKRLFLNKCYTLGS
jgi:hypothetical protein